MVRRRGGAGRDGVTATPAIAPSPIAPSPVAPSPLRRCIVTGEIRDRSALLRFVVDPQGAIVPDVDARLPGRGLWLLPRRDIVERAVSKRSFARAARRPVAASPELPHRVETLLVRRCCDALGLARRAGHAVAGFERVGEVVRRQGAALLLFALDSSATGRRKLAASAPEATLGSVLDSSELGMAFGRERVMFAAVGSGRLCERLLLDLGRLSGFRPSAAIDDQTDGGKQTNE